MKTKKYTLFFFTFIVFIVTPFIAKADYNQTITINNPFNCGGASSCTLLTLLTAILNNIVLPIAAVAAVMYVIFAGFKYVQARGNPAKVQEAHANLLWALIGIGVVLGAAGISAVLQATISSFLTK